MCFVRKSQQRCQRFEICRKKDKKENKVVGLVGDIFTILIYSRNCVRSFLLKLIFLLEEFCLHDLSRSRLPFK